MSLVVVAVVQAKGTDAILDILPTRLPISRLILALQPL